MSKPISHLAETARVSSHVTEHLANERTFLAWLRTSVAMMGFGVVIVRLREISPNAAVAHGHLHAAELGLMFAACGFLMMPLALWQYFAARRAIDAEEFRPAFWSILIFAATLCVLGFAVIFYLMLALRDTNLAANASVAMLNVGNSLVTSR